MKCSRCEKEFLCGANNSNQPCWCVAMPVLNPIPAEYEDCLCPECLKLFIKGPNQEPTKPKPN